VICEYITVVHQTNWLDGRLRSKEKMQPCVYEQNLVFDPIGTGD